MFLMVDWLTENIKYPHNLLSPNTLQTRITEGGTLGVLV